jgi:prophage maintenance system killer protein
MFIDGNKMPAKLTFESFARQNSLKIVSQQEILNVAGQVATGQITEIHQISKLLIK